MVKDVCRRCRRKTRRSTKKRTALPCTGRRYPLRRHSLYTWRVFWSSAPLHILRYPAYPSLSAQCFCLLWRQRRFLRHNLYGYQACLKLTARRSGCLFSRIQSRSIEEAEKPKKCGHIQKIEFDHVGFYYTDPQKPVLDNFSLTVSENEHLGIVGESGIGKSTVLRLLLRFWNVKSGRIRINGIPIEELSTAELRRRIAVLEQDTFLFDGSIAENIAIGKPDASMEEIQKAARRAGLHDFISTLPDGYDTQMGEMGARLSGGERTARRHRAHHADGP